MLVTVEDLSNYMDVTFSARQKIGVTMILEGLQSELESYLRRPIEVGQYTESFVSLPEDAWANSVFYDGGYALLPLGGYTLPVGIGLKNTPVRSIISVYAGRVGSASATPALQTVGRDYVLSPYGIDMLYGFSSYDTLTITYTAGLEGATIPVFRNLILRAASRESQNLHDDNKGIQNMEPREIAPALGTGFTEAELKSVKRYKRQRI